MLQRSHDRSSDLSRVTQNIGSRNAQSIDAPFAEPGVPLPIARRPITHLMCKAVHLDGEIGPGAEEVENERPGWMLPAEAMAPG